jgi:hypothetical protein
MAQQPAPVMLTRLYTGADNLTHVEQLALKFSPVAGAPATSSQSDAIPSANSYVVRLAPGFFQSWHNADKRRYVLTISGRAELEIGAGQKISIEPAQLILAEDLTGKGHTFRVLGDQPWVALFVDFAQ